MSDESSDHSFIESDSEEDYDDDAGVLHDPSAPDPDDVSLSSIESSSSSHWKPGGDTTTAPKATETAAAGTRPSASASLSSSEEPAKDEKDEANAAADEVDFVVSAPAKKHGRSTSRPQQQSEDLSLGLDSEHGRGRSFVFPDEEDSAANVPDLGFSSSSDSGAGEKDAVGELSIDPALMNEMSRFIEESGGKVPSRPRPSLSFRPSTVFEDVDTRDMARLAQWYRFMAFGDLDDLISLLMVLATKPMADWQPTVKSIKHDGSRLHWLHPSERDEVVLAKEQLGHKLSEFDKALWVQSPWTHKELKTRTPLHLRTEQFCDLSTPLMPTRGASTPSSRASSVRDYEAATGKKSRKSRMSEDYGGYISGGKLSGGAYPGQLFLQASTHQLQVLDTCTPGTVQSKGVSFLNEDGTLSKPGDDLRDWQRSGMDALQHDFSMKSLGVQTDFDSDYENENLSDSMSSMDDRVDDDDVDMTGIVGREARLLTGGVRRVVAITNPRIEKAAKNPYVQKMLRIEERLHKLNTSLDDFNAGVPSTVLSDACIPFLDEESGRFVPRPEHVTDTALGAHYLNELSGAKTEERLGKRPLSTLPFYQTIYSKTAQLFAEHPQESAELFQLMAEGRIRPVDLYLFDWNWYYMLFFKSAPPSALINYAMDDARDDPKTKREKCGKRLAQMAQYTIRTAISKAYRFIYNCPTDTIYAEGRYTKVDAETGLRNWKYELEEKPTTFTFVRKTQTKMEYLCEQKRRPFYLLRHPMWLQLVLQRLKRLRRRRLLTLSTRVDDGTGELVIREDAFMEEVFGELSPERWHEDDQLYRAIWDTENLHFRTPHGDPRRFDNESDDDYFSDEDSDNEAEAEEKKDATITGFHGFESAATKASGGFGLFGSKYVDSALDAMDASKMDASSKPSLIAYAPWFLEAKARVPTYDFPGDELRGKPEDILCQLRDPKSKKLQPLGYDLETFFTPERKRILAKFSLEPTAMRKAASAYIPQFESILPQVNYGKLLGTDDAAFKRSMALISSCIDFSIHQKFGEKWLFTEEDNDDAKGGDESSEQSDDGFGADGRRIYRGFQKKKVEDSGAKEAEAIGGGMKRVEVKGSVDLYLKQRKKTWFLEEATKFLTLSKKKFFDEDESKIGGSLWSDHFAVPWQCGRITPFWSFEEDSFNLLGFVHECVTAVDYSHSNIPSVEALLAHTYTETERVHGFGAGGSSARGSFVELFAESGDAFFKTFPRQLHVGDMRTKEYYLFATGICSRLRSARKLSDEDSSDSESEESGSSDSIERAARWQAIEDLKKRAEIPSHVSRVAWPKSSLNALRFDVRGVGRKGVPLNTANAETHYYGRGRDYFGRAVDRHLPGILHSAPLCLRPVNETRIAAIAKLVCKDYVSDTEYDDESSSMGDSLLSI